LNDKINQYSLFLTGLFSDSNWLCRLLIFTIQKFIDETPTTQLLRFSGAFSEPFLQILSA
ncbi:MAG: hypothetical protein ACW7DV_14710, partial [Paraglaciecola chathamensis]